MPRVMWEWMPLRLSTLFRLVTTDWRSDWPDLGSLSVIPVGGPYEVHSWQGSPVEALGRVGRAGEPGDAAGQQGSWVPRVSRGCRWADPGMPTSPATEATVRMTWERVLEMWAGVYERDDAELRVAWGRLAGRLGRVLERVPGPGHRALMSMPRVPWQ